MKIIARNRKAFHDYIVYDRLEVGVALRGDEVKSVRAGDINLKGSFVVPHQNQLYLLNCHISPYSHAFQKPREEDRTRTRRLLAHKREIRKLIGKASMKGYTLIPLSAYISDKGLVKFEIGLCKHKKAYQKREELKERDVKRQAQREIKGKIG